MEMEKAADGICRKCPSCGAELRHQFPMGEHRVCLICRAVLPQPNAAGVEADEPPAWIFGAVGPGKGG